MSEEFSYLRSRRIRPIHVVLAMLGLIIAFAIDLPLRGWLGEPPRDIDKLDWIQFLRTGGYAPLWLGIAVAILLEDRRRWGAWSKASIYRGISLTVAVALAGLGAEILKLIFRRQRPKLSDGLYQFRPWVERPFDAGGLTLPSSHAMIAFAAAAMLGRFFPAGAPVFWLFALGTAASRVISGAHYVSDVYVAFLAGWTISNCSELLVRNIGKPRPLGQESKDGCQLL